MRNRHNFGGPSLQSQFAHKKAPILSLYHVDSILMHTCIGEKMQINQTPLFLVHKHSPKMGLCFCMRKSDRFLVCLPSGQPSHYEQWPGGCLVLRVNGSFVVVLATLYLLIILFLSLFRRRACGAVRKFAAAFAEQIWFSRLHRVL